MKRIVLGIACAVAFAAAASSSPAAVLSIDARSDLVYQNPSTGEVRRMRVSGNSVTPTGWVSSELSSAWKVVAEGDFNGDGITDLVYRNQSSGQVKLLSYSAFSSPQVDNLYNEPNLGWKIVQATDLDGDGMSDLVWWNSITGEVFAMQLGGAAIVRQGLVYREPDRAWRIVASGDFAGSGKANQLLWRNSDTGQIYMMTIASSAGGYTQAGAMVYAEPDAAWQIAGTADLDGDGKSDILWRNDATGHVYAMLMDNGAIAGQAMVYREPNLAWKIVATGDFDGDGKADIVWRNSTSGQLYMMRMNGLAVASGAFVYTESDTAWKVMGPAEIAVSPQGPDFTRCNAPYVPPLDLTTAKLGGLGNPLLQRQKSGQVVSIPLPVTGAISGMVQFGESAGGAYTPQPVTLEITISKCPGQIEPDTPDAPSGQFCSVYTTNGNYSAVTWLAKPYNTLGSAKSASLYGLCWAGEPGVQYYVNARWSYRSCAFGAQTCGFAIQHNLGPY